MCGENKKIDIVKLCSFCLKEVEESNNDVWSFCIYDHDARNSVTRFLEYIGYRVINSKSHKHIYVETNK